MHLLGVQLLLVLSVVGWSLVTVILGWLGFRVVGFRVLRTRVYFLNLLRRPRTTGLRLSGLLHLRPKTSFCYALGELCPYLFVFELMCLFLSLFVV